MKICFISAKFSVNNDLLINSTIKNKNKNYDYILFTNLECENPNANDGWKIIKINIDEPFLTDVNIKYNNDRMLYKKVANYFKFMGWRWFKGNNIKYDIIIWSDGRHIPKSTIDWEFYGNLVKNYKYGYLTGPNPRDSYEVCDNLARLNIETEQNMSSLKEYFEYNKYPKGKLMVTTTTFIYDPNNSIIINALDDFWSMYSENTFFRRDQPIWGYFLWKHSVQPLIQAIEPNLILSKKNEYSRELYELSLRLLKCNCCNFISDIKTTSGIDERIPDGAITNPSQLLTYSLFFDNGQEYSLSYRNGSL